MNAILTLVRKDFALFWRDRAAVLLTFIIPFALIYLFGYIFGVNRTDPGPSGIPLAVVNQSDDPAAAEVVEALREEPTFNVITTTKGDDGKERPLTEQDLRPLIRKDEFRFAIVLPEDLLSAPGGGLHAKYFENPRNSVETQMVSGILQKTIFTKVPRLFGRALQSVARREIGGEHLESFNRRVADAVAAAFGGDAEIIYQKIEAGNFGFDFRDDPEGDGGQAGGGDAADAEPGEGDFEQRLSEFVQIDREQVVGADIENPMATQMIGGWSMQFLLFAVSGAATALFQEKDRGIFQRVLAGPVSRGAILWSKFLYGVVLGEIQLVVLFLSGQAIFNVDVLPHLGPLLVVSFFAAAACASFGMLLAAVSKTPETARGLATLLILLMSAIGGAWFPLSLMPELIQQIAKVTLVYWAMEGFSQVLWAHAPFVQLLPTLGVLAGITTVVMAIAWTGFRRGRMFA